MTLVKILPEILSNKIAAGEVVERPASVVKELVENALDAQSTQIHVEVEKGGRSLIRVSDNGSGMSHDDALLSIERYATSKIYTDKDLFSIRTLGFRGEALPSIAAVSRFSMITRDAPSAAGTQIRVEGGRIGSVSETGAPIGTMIAVKDLFFNIPVRRKFLKTVDTEMGHIADTLSRIAMGHPGCRFKLTHNGRDIFNWAPASDPLNRTVDILGDALRGDLLSLDCRKNGVGIQGWVASHRHSRNTAVGIYLYVNRRFVRDKVITHGLFEGFSGRLMKGKYPVAVIFITVAPDLVDVNVHPTKHEVRFADHKTVHDLVSQAVAGALKSGEKTSFPVHLPESRPVGNRPHQSIRHLPTLSRSVESGSEYSRKPVPLFPEVREQQPLWQNRLFSDMRIVGQIHNTYLVCESPDGCVLIDQHAAHERIMYEKIKNRASDRPVSGQKLLMPEIIELGIRESTVLNDLIPELNRSGWEIEPFGGESFAVKAVPGIMAEIDILPVIREMVDKVVEMGFAADLENAVEESRKIMACHSAVRARQSLSVKEGEALLEQLDACENPSNCPHGRPTWIRWSKSELEKLFRRIT